MTECLDSIRPTLKVMEQVAAEQEMTLQEFIEETSVQALRGLLWDREGVGEHDARVPVLPRTA
jgi:hypothetical protein